MSDLMRTRVPTDSAGRTADWVIEWDTAGDPAPSPPPAGWHPWPAGSWERRPSGGWVAYEGHLFDRAHLASTLGERADASEASLVGAAFERWGTAALDRLRGTWLLAFWDAASGTLHVARDAMGIQPVQYRWDGRRLLLSSAVEEILRRPEVPLRVRPTAMAELLLLRFSPASVEETFFEGISRLPAGHRLEARRGTLTVRRWWDPLPADFSWASASEIDGFEDVFGRAVERVLDAGADSLALSGGFDSVGIAAMAVHRRPQRQRLHAVSLRFPGTDCDEATTQVAVADLLRMPRTMVTLGEGLEGENLVEAALSYDYFSPMPVLGIWNALYTRLFHAAHAAGCRSMIFGTGGDEMLVVDFSHAQDCLRQGQILRLWRYLRAVQRTSPFSPLHIARLVVWDSAVAPSLRGAVALAVGRVAPRALARIRHRRFQARTPSWIGGRDSDLARRLEERATRSGFETRGRDGAYLARMRHLTRAPLLHLEFDQAFGWARHLGLKALYPFFDRDLVDLSLRIHPQDLIAEGRFKSPLRRTVRRLLPGASMPVRKVDFTEMMRAVLRRDGSGAWRGLGGPARLAALGAVDPAPLERMLLDFWVGRSRDALRPWLVLSAERWLENLTRWKSANRGMHENVH